MKDESRADRWAELDEVRAAYEPWDGESVPPLEVLCPYEEADERTLQSIRATAALLDDEPFVLLMTYVEFGVSPPPELLLWLRRRWCKFLVTVDNGANVDLETAMVGSGDLANRLSRKVAELGVAIKFIEHYRTGMTKSRAAFQTVKDLNLPICPEAVLKKPAVRELVKEHDEIRAKKGQNRKNASSKISGIAGLRRFPEE